MKPVRKAVFPVGGMGTRFLPATKAVPKEMLPVVDKPLLQYAVDEALAAGIEQMIFVTARGKNALEDYFDFAGELVAALKELAGGNLAAAVYGVTLLPGSARLEVFEAADTGECATVKYGDSLTQTAVRKDLPANVGGTGFVLEMTRTIGGQVRRYVERFDDRDFTTAEDAFFVDCGITYNGAATATISGLGHLEGREVTALADGDVVAGLTVTGGKVTLPQPASKVHVGLPFSAMFENLPPAIQFDDVGSSRGRPHSVSAVRIQMERTRGIKIATQDGRTNEIVQTGYDLADPIPLTTGMHALTMPCDWNEDGTVIVKQDYPLPMTILALSVVARFVLSPKRH